MSREFRKWLAGKCSLLGYLSTFESSGWSSFSSTTCRVGHGMQVRVSKAADYRGLPSCHGIRVSPSGHLPSSLVRPTSCLVMGMPEGEMARAITSLMAWCLAILLTHQAINPLCICYGATSTGVGDTDAAAEVQRNSHSNCLVCQPQPTRGDRERQKPVSTMRGHSCQKSGHVIWVGNGRLYSSLRRQNAWFIPERLLVRQRIQRRQGSMFCLPH